MEYTVGQVVISKQGRDQCGAFVVVALEGDFLYLADGKKRPLSRPKKKRKKHVQKTNTVFPQIRQKILENGYLLDADIKKALKEVGGNE